MLENDTQSFLQMPAIDNIVQYASVACTMLHNEAQSSALRFLSELTDVADPDAVITCLLATAIEMIKKQKVKKKQINNNEYKKLSYRRETARQLRMST